MEKLSEKRLSEHIKLCKERNEESIIYMIQKFNRLLIKYSKLLGYEDAINDLLEHFLITLYKIPEFVNEAMIISYINSSIKNHYINLSIKKNLYRDKFILIPDFSDKIIGTNYQENSILYDTINKLPGKQKCIIILFFFMAIQFVK